jgi:hypothetical protein
MEEEFWNVNENAIEFLRNDDTMTCTFSQPRFINRVKRLAACYPDEVDVRENPDGTVIAHLPVSYLHITNYKRFLTPEQQKEFSERGKKLAELQRQRREAVQN